MHLETIVTAPWLSIVIDLLLKTLAYTKERKDQALAAITTVLSSVVSTPRLLLGIAGQLNSLPLVLRPKALMTPKSFTKNLFP